VSGTNGASRSCSRPSGGTKIYSTGFFFVLNQGGLSKKVSIKRLNSLNGRKKENRYKPRSTIPKVLRRVDRKGSTPHLWRTRVENLYSEIRFFSTMDFGGTKRQVPRPWHKHSFKEGRTKRRGEKNGHGQQKSTL